MTHTFPTGFASYAYEGDTITLQHEGITYTATIERDNDAGPPDERDEGFWPSLDAKDAGYIGQRSKVTLARHKARAQAVMDAWKKDEWFYCGIVISASVDGVELDDHAASLWGIECNYPASPRNKNPNSYLRTVADELMHEARHAAKRAATHIKDAMAKVS